jgi:glutaredoxin 2
MTEIKKSILFRYTEETENLFETGFALYKNENTTPKFSINQLIDMCVKKAIVFYPSRVEQMKISITKLETQLKKADNDKLKAINELQEIKSLLKQKSDIDNQLKNLSL